MIENYLSKLGNMLQKRKRPSFKSDLRAQLLNRALELNEAPVKKSWDWQNFLIKRLAPATAAVMIVVLAFQFLLPTGSLLPQLVNVAEAKDYYVLTPETEDETGIASETSFMLTSKGAIDAEEVENVLSVKPETELTLDQVSDTEIRVTPETDLEAGTVVTFSLQAQNLDDSPYPKEYNWAYEVSDEFRVSGTLPGDRESGAPTNTGIEVSFTHYGVTTEAFKNAFTISPAVSGTFEVNGKVGVFAPSGGLSESTVYTVTIDGNLAAGEKTLGENVVFQFETSDEMRASTTLNFTRKVYEFSPEEVPQMQFYYWEESGEPTLTGDLSVYAYPSGDEYFEAMQDYRKEVPQWTYYQQEYYEQPTEDLEVVLTAEDYSFAEDGSYWLTLPEALPEGYYLLEFSKNDDTEQVFLQISPQAVYLNLNKNGALVWVNSTETGEAVKGATVQVLDYEEKTDGEGLAFIEGLYEEESLESEEWNHLFFTVTSDDTTTYYETPFYRGGENPDDLYWNFTHTDRSTYQPSDTAHYWGFVQGREQAIDEGATAYLVDGYVYGVQSIRELKDTYTVIDQQSLSLKDGEAFAGEFSFEKLPTGAYSILIMQGDSRLSSTEFYVENYVKPAYEIIVDAEKTALYNGDTARATITAQFFEGTPVPNTAFTVEMPGRDSEVMTTDSNGQIQVEWTIDAGDCGGDYCSIYDNATLVVTPVQEELGEIQEYISFKVFNSGAVVDDENAVYNNDEISFRAYEVDLEQVDYDGSAFAYYYDMDKIYGEGAASSRVEMAITQVDYVKTEVGERYDPVSKTVQKVYDYNREETVISTQTLSPNGKGEYSIEPGLSDEYDYEVKLKVFDEAGRYYFENFTINNNRSYLSRYDTYMRLTVEGASSVWSDGVVQLGEEVTMNIVEKDPENPYSGRFLYLQNQAGLQKYEVRDQSNYQFEFGKEHVPTVYVEAVNFDGQYYRMSGTTGVHLDKEDRHMSVEVKADQASYEPGEEVTLTIKTGEASSVNLFLVDEAYYALYAESMLDPVDELYSGISSGVDYTYISHRAIMFEGDGGKGGCFIAGTMILMADGSSKPIEAIEAGDQVLTRKETWSDELVAVEVLNTVRHDVGEYLLVNGHLGVTEEHVLFINGQWQTARELRLGDQLINSEGETVIVETIEFMKEDVTVYNFETANEHTYFANGIYVHNDKGGARTDFEDTAYFEVVQTDAAGNASVTFELPDNITTWRVSATAVSGGNEPMAGNTNIQIPVSKDVFINPIVNSTYLAGDQPSLPVRAYGDALSADSAVKFSVGIQGIYDESTDGVAYQTTYFDLPVLEEGSYEVSSTAEAGSLEDTVILPVEVIGSHLSQSTVDTALLEEGSSLSGSKTERTRIDFLNNEVGIIYGTLMEAYTQNGDRADEAVARTVAAEWFNQYFMTDYVVPEFPSLVYQEEEGDGGLALLPYSDSDLELSAKMAALAPEQVSLPRLVVYFENILNGEYTLNEKILALYGLAGLDQAYLTELKYFVNNFELEDEDKLFAALAFAEYGQDYEATELFLEIYEDADEEWTTLLATLAESIGSDQSEDLWALASEDLLEQMLYAKARLENGADASVSFEINGEKVELSGNEVYMRSFLPEELEDLSITDLEGEVMAVSSYRTPVDLADLETSNAVSITRSYWVDGKEVSSVKVGDLVEVHILVKIANDGAYEVTDVLPSGLQTATWATQSETYNRDDLYRHPYRQNGQTLSFYASCYEGRCYGNNFYYLARVVNPGTFVLEPALVQSYENLEVMNVSGERSTLTIEK